MQQRINTQEQEFIKDCISNEVKTFEIIFSNQTNVVSLSSAKDAKMVINLLYVLNYKAVLVQTQVKSQFEVLFN